MKKCIKILLYLPAPGATLFCPEFHVHSQQKDACCGHLLATPHKICPSCTRAPCLPPSPGRYSVSQLSEVFFSMLACSPACLQMPVPVSEQNCAILIGAAAAAAALSDHCSPNTSPTPSQQGKEELGWMILNRQEGMAAPEGLQCYGDTAQMWHELPWQAHFLSSISHIARVFMASLPLFPLHHNHFCSSHGEDGLDL